MKKISKCNLQQRVNKLKKVFDWVDSDIAKWYKVKPVMQNENSGPIVLFSIVSSHCQIFDDDQHYGVHERHSFDNALALAEKRVKTGEINEPGKDVIYLKDLRPCDNCFCRLRVHRRENGDIELHIDEVGLNFKSSAGDGVLYAN